MADSSGRRESWVGRRMLGRGTTPALSFGQCYLHHLSSFNLSRGEDKFQALNVLCHSLLGSSSKMSGYYLLSSLLTRGSRCFVGMWPFFSSSSLLLSVHFPDWHTSPPNCHLFNSHALKPCYFFFLVFLFCIMAGGSHLDRNQTTASSPSA